MKTAIITGITAGLLFFAMTGPVKAATIDDNYVGAGYSEDVYGRIGIYDIDRMDVSFSGSTMEVKIFSDFFWFLNQQNSSATSASHHCGGGSSSGINWTLGDLFLSSNGWNPFGSAPYGSDDHSNGEIWEYAVVLDSHDASTTSGNLALYQVDQGRIVLSTTSATPNRPGHEVLYDHNGLAWVNNGTWEFTFVNGNNYSETAPDDVYDYMTMSFDIAGTNLTSSGTGLHWAETCANDVIEGPGSSPVPIPPSALLLFPGVAILVGNRIRLRKNDS
ncbi:MAG: hypothetical protein L3J03_04700 [Desulfobacterales bacterium]|nr:hypothetical protein [Desulfobacterales bacterium]